MIINEFLIQQNRIECAKQTPNCSRDSVVPVSGIWRDIPIKKLAGYPANRAEYPANSCPDVLAVAGYPSIILKLASA